MNTPMRPKSSWIFLVLAFEAIGIATVAGCGSSTPAITERPIIPYVDAGPYPQASTDIAPPTSPACAVTDDFVKTCASLAKAGCPEAGKDGAGRACPDHLAANVCSEHTVIPTKCAIDADGDRDKIRSCGGPTTLRWRCIVP